MRTILGTAAVLVISQPAWSETMKPTFQGLGDLPGGSFASEAADVSADGSTVVGFGNSYMGIAAFRWTQAGGMVSLGDLPGGGYASRSFGVSGDGSTIVGRSVSALGPEAYRWTMPDGTAVALIGGCANYYDVDRTGGVLRVTFVGSIDP